MRGVFTVDATFAQLSQTGALDMTLTISPSNTRRDIGVFIDLPPKLYTGMPGYEPPMRMDRALLLAPRKGAFFKQGRVQYWMARRNGAVVGRISAQVGQAEAAGVPEGAGMFGCLDCIDDEEVVAALLQTAQDWLRDQGCSHIYGPMLLDMNGEPGLLVSGFEEPPMTMTPWHPPYLAAHIEAQGLTKWRDLLSFRMRLEDYALKPPKKTRQRDQYAKFRSITPASIARDLPILRDTYNDGWKRNWGFVPITLADFKGLTSLMRPFLPAQTGTVVEVDGAPVAILLIVPNMFELTKGLGPKPSPLGWLRLGLRALWFRPTSYRIILMGIASEFRYKQMEKAALLMRLSEGVTIEKISANMNSLEAGWVLEDNVAVLNIIRRGGFKHTRTFRLYGKPLCRLQKERITS
jgi:hypothetical protein